MNGITFNGLGVGIAILASAPPASAQELLYEYRGTEDARISSCEGLADLNGDGFAEFAVSKSGTLRIHSGRDGALWREHRGQDALLVDDLDRDGTRDYLVADASSRRGGALGGAVVVHSGATGAVMDALLGDAPQRLFGSYLADAGDVDGDGMGDWLVGEFDSIPEARTFLYSGATRQEIRHYVYHNDDPVVTGLLLGTGVGDVDGDGHADYCLAEHHGLADNSVWVYSGRSGSVLHTFDSFAESLGAASVGLGDLDADGLDDFALGAPSVEKVFIYSGMDASLLVELAGKSSSSFGLELASGDANGDSVRDLFVGAPGRDNDLGPAVGSVHVFSLDTEQVLYRFDGIQAFDFFGSDLGIADVNGDGLDDLLVTAFLDQDFAGRVQVLAGNDLWLSSPKRRLHGGDTATLNLRQGEPGQPALFFLARLNDVSSLQPWTPLQFLDSLGSASWSATVPAGLAGLTAGFQGFARAPDGRLMATAVETLEFQ